ncbi:MAG: Baseplate family protein [Clostridiales bacterium]|jgi:uncharacterized phage protein gp47/JayE|nr:Baseplate family protein [Clostridiales bacterium]
MYENLTVEEVKSDILGRLASDIDVREGSYFNDMISAVAHEIWKNYQSLDAIVPIAYVDETSGDYIDKRCAEYGITRKSGAKATTVLTFTGVNGTIIPKAKVFLTADGLEFTTNETVTIADGTAMVTASSAEIGETYNVGAGLITRQFVNLSGLSTITNEVAKGGANAETDDSLIARLYNYLQNPSTSGNANHYKEWALEVDGVGSAKVTPLWDGPGTVRVLIVGRERETVDSTIVTKCSDYIERNRPIGAAVTVESASGLSINIDASVTIDSSVTLAAVNDAFESALRAYLKTIAFETYTVVYNRIVYILLDITGVIDCTALSINGGTENIIIGGDQVPVLGAVMVS